MTKQHPLTNRKRSTHHPQSTRVIITEHMTNLMSQHGEQVNVAVSLTASRSCQGGGISQIKFRTVTRSPINKPTKTSSVQINEDGITTSLAQDAIGQISDLNRDGIKPLKLLCCEW